jgi:hypothetical protein
MGLLDTTMEVAKLAGKVANPELVQEAMKANAEAAHGKYNEYTKEQVQLMIQGIQDFMTRNPA